MCDRCATTAVSVPPLPSPQQLPSSQFLRLSGTQANHFNFIIIGLSNTCKMPIGSDIGVPSNTVVRIF